jgi:hypothetical protein
VAIVKSKQSTNPLKNFLPEKRDEGWLNLFYNPFFVLLRTWTQRREKPMLIDHLFNPLLDFVWAASLAALRSVE